MNISGVAPICRSLLTYLIRKQGGGEKQSRNSYFGSLRERPIHQRQERAAFEAKTAPKTVYDEKDSFKGLK
jgi:hypothetical protein